MTTEETKHESPGGKEQGYWDAMPDELRKAIEEVQHGREVCLLAKSSRPRPEVLA